MFRNRLKRYAFFLYTLLFNVQHLVQWTPGSGCAWALARTRLFVSGLVHVDMLSRYNNALFLTNMHICTPDRQATAGNSKCVYPSESMVYDGDKIYNCYIEQEGGIPCSNRSKECAFQSLSIFHTYHFCWRRICKRKWFRKRNCVPRKWMVRTRQMCWNSRRRRLFRSYWTLFWQIQFSDCICHHFSTLPCRYLNNSIIFSAGVRVKWPAVVHHSWWNDYDGRKTSPWRRQFRSLRCRRNEESLVLVGMPQLRHRQLGSSCSQRWVPRVTQFTDLSKWAVLSLNTCLLTHIYFTRATCSQIFLVSAVACPVTFHQAVSAICLSNCKSPVHSLICI